MKPLAAIRPRVIVLATGGTIAGLAGAPLDRGYEAGAVGIAALIASAAPIETLADLSAEQIASIGSQDIGLDIWRLLHARIAEIFASGTAEAVVVVHGTDTLEETAFLLDLITPPGSPVVLVGAMRPGNAPSADGPGNLVAAIRVAIDPQARDRGVLVVMNDAIHAANRVRKVHASQLDAFASASGGALGTTSAASAHFFAAAAPSAASGSLALPPFGALPTVGIVHAHADMDGTEVEALVARGVAGIVLAGVGNGNASRLAVTALADAARRGIAIVRSTRTGAGRIERNVEMDDDSLGFVAARDLGPPQSRLLLQLILTAGKTGADAIQSAFDAV